MGRPPLRGSPDPRLCLVASAGPGEGRGHLSRALALAEAAQELGVACRIALLRGTPSDGELARAARSGSQLATSDTLVIPAPGEHVVVDLPDPNEAGPAILASATVFDDSERLVSAARVVVQPSQPGWGAGAGGTAQAVLAGYALAPLGRAVLAARSGRVGEQQGGGVLVCFGGSDPFDVAGRLVPALLDAVAAVTVVIGPDYRGALAPDGRCVLRDPGDLVRRLSRAAIAVLGAGTMKFEAAALGVPAILVAAANDQVSVGPPYALTGAAVWAGDGRSVDPAIVASLLAALARNDGWRANMSRRGPEVVPGDGARRIVAATMAGTSTGDRQ